MNIRYRFSIVVILMFFVALDRACALSEQTKGNDLFAFDLFQELSETEKGNLFFSPISISSALAMTYLGASGTTAAEMKKALRFQLSGEALHEAFAEDVEEILMGNSPGVEIALANALWGQKTYPFKEKFLSSAKHFYGANLEQLNFAEPEAARSRINSWVARQTKDRIQDLIARGVLNADSRLVLTNAIYFKGKWQTPFSADATREEKFSLTSGEQVNASMMHQLAHFPLLETADFQMLELLYQGGEFSMVLLLPKSVDGIAALEKKITASTFSDWRKEMKSTEVSVALPRFTCRNSFQVDKPLKAFGMVQSFDPELADFSGMADRRELFIGAVIHQAFVEVAEEGTEAAAATAVVMQARGMRPMTQPKIFRADHPFLFVLQHKKSGALLFLGRLNDPRP